MNGGTITEIGIGGIRVGIKNSDLGVLNSKDLLAIQEEMLSVIGVRSSGSRLDWKYKFRNH